MRRGIGRLRAGGNTNPIPGLFAAGEQGAWYDPSDFSTMFQDSAGTTAVTATGQPVGKILDKSGRGNHATQPTTTQRPLLQQDGSGFYYLSFDGVDDRLASSTVNLTGTAQVTVFAGVATASAVRAAIVSNNAAAFTENGKFDLESNNSAGNYAFLANGSSLGECYTASNYPFPNSSVLSCVFDTTQATNATQIAPRINAVTPAIGSRVGGTGAGNFANATIGVGAWTGGSIFLNGRIYQIVVRGANSTVGQITSAERYVGSKMGIAL